MSGESSDGMLLPAGWALQSSTAVPGNHCTVYSGYLEKPVTVPYWYRCLPSSLIGLVGTTASHPEVGGQLGLKKEFESLGNIGVRKQKINLIYLQWKLKALLQLSVLVGISLNRSCCPGPLHHVQT